MDTGLLQQQTHQGVVLSFASSLVISLQGTHRWPLSISQQGDSCLPSAQADASVVLKYSSCVALSYIQIRHGERTLDGRVSTVGIIGLCNNCVVASMQPLLWQSVREAAHARGDKRTWWHVCVVCACACACACVCACVSMRAHAPGTSSTSCASRGHGQCLHRFRQKCNSNLRGCSYMHMV